MWPTAVVSCTPSCCDASFVRNAWPRIRGTGPTGRRRFASSKDHPCLHQGSLQQTSRPRTCDVPCLLVTRLPGRPLERRSRSPRFLEELAETLASIHAVDCSAASRVPLDRPYYKADRLKPPAWSHRFELWQQAIRAATSPSPALSGCFLHRDYHPGNTLWLRGRLSGVVDWTSASFGPASVDVGHMRWNLALSKGVRAADRFLELYRLASGQRMNHQPYFDVRTVVDLIPDLSPDPQGRNISRLETYLEIVLERV